MNQINLGGANGISGIGSSAVRNYASPNVDQ